MLKNKYVVLGVTGSIAAYKAASLASALTKLHCDVQVIMTANAANFINPVTFETLTGRKCLVDTFDRNFSFEVEHISVAKRADLVLVAIRPGAAIEWVRQHAPLISKSAILVDLCGVKRTVVASIAPVAEQYGFAYIGGHPMAAGLSLQEKDVEEFRRRMNENCTLTSEDLTEVERIDMVLPFRWVTESLIEELELLEPFGKGNTRPVFAVRNVRVLESRVLGKNQNMLRVKLMDEEGTVMEGLYFREEMQQVLSDLQGKDRFHFLYYPEINEYRGRRQLQARILDYC